MSTYRVEDKRGIFKANGLTFRVKPVDGTETIPFYALMTEAQRMAKAEGRVQTSLLLVRLFSDFDENGNPNKYPLFKTIKIKFCEWFFKDYRRYERYPMGKKGYDPPLEKLVTVAHIGYEQRPIRYYNLKKSCC